jgi:hypothetical protein
MKYGVWSHLVAEHGLQCMSYADAAAVVIFPKAKNDHGSHASPFRTLGYKLAAAQ